MTREEWLASEDALGMLRALHYEHPEFLASRIREIHRFLIACCWRHKNLIPQEHLRNGLRAAERWLAGDIDDGELNNLNWYAEAEAFMIDYAKSPDEIAELQSMIASIDEIRGLPFEEARSRLVAAAYFAEGSMIYSLWASAPWTKTLFEAPFLSAELLREHLDPPL